MPIMFLSVYSYQLSGTWNEPGLRTWSAYDEISLYLSCQYKHWLNINVHFTEDILANIFTPITYIYVYIYMDALSWCLHYISVCNALIQALCLIEAHLFSYYTLSVPTFGLATPYTLTHRDLIRVMARPSLRRQITAWTNVYLLTKCLAGTHSWSACHDTQNCIDKLQWTYMSNVASFRSSCNSPLRNNPLFPRAVSGATSLMTILQHLNHRGLKTH